MPTNQPWTNAEMESLSIGFMQGRLSPVLNGKIQEFPWNNWRSEFNIASTLGFKIMEWTLDQNRLYENPLMSVRGQKEIKELCQDNELVIPSLTGDCFMQAPFWKFSGSERSGRQDDFMCILDACFNVGISQVVIPLVDNGRLDNKEQSKALLEFLNDNECEMSERGIKIAFESDFAPDDLQAFIGQFNTTTFGINYDIGNSASLGFDVEKEFQAYGQRILNVHVKDRLLNGTTVPLGDGNADFVKVFRLLKECKYAGNYILQTARARDGKHANVLSCYKSMVELWLQNNGA